MVLKAVNIRNIRGDYTLVNFHNKFKLFENENKNVIILNRIYNTLYISTQKSNFKYNIS